MGLALVREPEDDGFEEAEEQFGAMAEFLKSMEAGRMTESDLERQLEQEGRELLRKLLAAHVQMRAPGEAEGPVIDAEGLRRSEKRSHQRGLVTSFGEIEVPRTGYARAGEGSLHPLDGEMNLPRESYSLELRRKVAWETARGSFEEGQEAIERQTGVKIPKRQVEELAGRAAVDFQSFYKARSEAGREATEPGEEAPAEEPLPLLIISFDGKGVVVREQDLRESTKLRRKGEKNARPGCKRMAIVATVYNVAPFVRTPLDIVEGLFPIDDSTAMPPRRKRKQQKKQARPRPRSKRVWASLARQPEEVMAEAFAEAAARDPQRRRTWVVLVDGEPHQLRLVRRFQKQYQFQIVLDFFHVLQRLWAAARALCPEDKWQQQSYVRTRAQRVLSGWASQVAGGMRAAATHRDLAKKDREPVDDACDYLVKHRRYLPYGDCLEAGLPIATGVIEGTCRSLIVHRMDRSGARWSLSGAE
ncbi:MAG: ISKra4 family transposase, partial [bacterium]|nr:ISKra4 family transposase [bacterium]